MKALMDRAAADTEMDNRERAIVGLGKSLAQPNPAAKSAAGEAGDAALDAIRLYTRPENPVPVRAAAWDALSYPPRLGESDLNLIQQSLQTEKDSYVRKSLENAFRHQAARIRDLGNR